MVTMVTANASVRESYPAHEILTRRRERSRQHFKALGSLASELCLSGWWRLRCILLCRGGVMHYLTENVRMTHDICIHIRSRGPATMRHAQQQHQGDTLVSRARSLSGIVNAVNLVTEVCDDITSRRSRLAGTASRIDVQYTEYA